MSLPIRLDKALVNGTIRILNFTDTSKRSPAKGYRWLILYGRIHHVTATDSEIILYQKINAQAATIYWTTEIKAADPNGEYPLFNTVASLDQAQYSLIILDETLELRFDGDTNAYAKVAVLEWRVIP